MLKELFEQEQRYLSYFFEHLDIKAAEQLLDILFHCPGVAIFTGIGKSGLVAKKIAVTMTSTGSRAFYLSPTNAMHGDIGIVTEKDVFIMLSKSGESDELLNLVPFMRNRGIKLISIVSNPNSRLAKACDFFVNLPLQKELCPFDLVPTTSTAIQMIFGDVLAVALMSRKKFSLDEYALNHPAGRIGRRITTKVKDLMISGTGIPKCTPNDKLVDILVELSNKRCGCILIVNEAHIFQGIFTDGDLRRALQHHGPKALEVTMHELMTHSAKFIGPHELAWEAMQVMESDQKHPVTVLPVLEDGNKVVGLIKMHDIVQSGI